MAGKSLAQVRDVTDVQKSRDKNIHLTESENLKYTLHSMNLMQLPRLDLKFCKPAEIHQRSLQYFEFCNNDNMKPTVAGYALALGISRSMLTQIISGVVAVPRDNRDEVERFYTVLNSLIEDYMSDSKINPVSGIFMMKNNFGYKDQQEIVAVDNREENTTPEALIAESNLLLSGDSKKADYEIGKEL